MEPRSRSRENAFPAGSDKGESELAGNLTDRAGFRSGQQGVAGRLRQALAVAAGLATWRL